MNFLCLTLLLSLLFGTSFSSQVVSKVISNQSNGSKSDFSNSTYGFIGGTLSDISGLEVASNISLPATMIEKIFLWTHSLDSGGQYELLELGNASSITSSHFVPNKPTFILVHGFLGDGLEPWILGIKDKLIAQVMCNVVSVQWPSGHEYLPIDYWHVTSHVPVVGAGIAALLDMLAQLRQQKNSAVHIIGHSLGAHIAGFVGKHVVDPIGRISGLDPAGFAFHNRDPSQRLDISDATYVDVIHTNGCRSYLSFTDCFGIDIALGHTDYWPNGGRHQPACHGKRRQHKQRTAVKYTKRRSKVSWSVGCDHMMSHTYFLESLNYNSTSEMFRARPCESYHLYNDGNCSCGPVKQVMGFYSNHRGEGDFYLNTSSSAPYALPDLNCPTELDANVSWSTVIFYFNCTSCTLIGVGWVLCYRPASRRSPEPIKSKDFASTARNEKCTCGQPDCTVWRDGPLVL